MFAGPSKNPSVKNTLSFIGNLMKLQSIKNAYQNYNVAQIATQEDFLMEALFCKFFERLFLS